MRARFEATGLGMLATLRADGAPRISGVEPWFGDGELWLGMMPESLKAKDLQRDPRFALHAATADKQMTDGDAKLAGSAIEVTDEATIDRARKSFAEVSGHEPPPGPMHLFRLDVTEVVFLTVATDHMVHHHLEAGRWACRPSTGTDPSGDQVSSARMAASPADERPGRPATAPRRAHRRAWPHRRAAGPRSPPAEEGPRQRTGQDRDRQHDRPAAGWPAPSAAPR